MADKIIDIPQEPVQAETFWLDMATGEIVKEWSDTVSRYRPGDVEFSLYAENNLYVKRNVSKSGA